ncbi:MAG TPA: class I SAM-dependent methyltransferase [Candidatus Bathyarchaeia archaeon]|nr:class I SAM-dependent methyltransferase [Candidatus Bathyarchaeia archaeon]
MHCEVYAHPKYYDIAFGWDPRKELDFLDICFRNYGRPRTRRVLELGSGTGRLLFGLAKRGYKMIGVEKSPSMVDYVQSKSGELRLPVDTVLADMASFRLSETVDAAFCAINTFRYLLSEETAGSHLDSVGMAMKPGGVYLIDFNLVGKMSSYPKKGSEEWNMSDKDTTVKAVHKVLGVPDEKKRLVIERLVLEVNVQCKHIEFLEEGPMRTYTLDQFKSLVDSSGFFRIVAWHGPNFDPNITSDPGPESERVVVVLKRR